MAYDRDKAEPAAALRPAQPAEKTPRMKQETEPRCKPSGLKAGLRRAGYHVWKRLPRWSRRLAVRVTAQRVTLGVCAIILDARGWVLLAHHTYRRRPWGLPGGFVGKDEQPIEGLARELREELGVPAQVGPLILAEIEPTSRLLTLFYRATLLDTPQANGEEVDGLRYVAPEEARALLGREADSWLQQVRVE